MSAFKGYTNDMPGENNNALINDYHNYCVYRSTRCKEQPLWEHCGELPRHNIKTVVLRVAT